MSAVRHLLGSQILGGPWVARPQDALPGTEGINIPVIDVATGRAITVRTMGFALENPAGESSTRTSATPASATSAPTTVSSKVWSPRRPGVLGQYHPEAAAGLHDAAYFDKFATAMEKH